MTSRYLEHKQTPGHMTSLASGIALNFIHSFYTGQIATLPSGQHSIPRLARFVNQNPRPQSDANPPIATRATNRAEHQLQAGERSDPRGLREALVGD
jgi:hypothetical protein